MKTLSFFLLAFFVLFLNTISAVATGIAPTHRPERDRQSNPGESTPGVDSPATRKQQFNLENGVAIQGYDPVAYFTQNKALKGSASNTVAYKNVTYRFATTANLKAFQQNPDKYEPQYGGWCAYAMGAAGEKVEIDPETFKITGGKLFLFYHTFINNTLTKWNKDEPNLLKKADESWVKFTRS